MAEEPKRIIILGTGESCKLCDFRDEVWGVNGAYTIYHMIPEKFKKFFHIEKLFMTDYLWSEVGNLNFHLGELNQLAKDWNYEILSMRRFKLGKEKLNCKLYPFKAVTEFFGSDYFTDTITYMIAYALYQNCYLAENEHGVIRPELKYPLTLRLFGVDMSTTVEYHISKPGIEWWLGLARGLGAGIEISLGSVIMQNPRGQPYGFWRERIKKFDLDLIDPNDLLGRRKNKRPVFGSEKIQALMGALPNEQMYRHKIHPD